MVHHFKFAEECVNTILAICSCYYIFSRYYVFFTLYMWNGHISVIYYCVL